MGQSETRAFCQIKMIAIILGFAFIRPALCDLDLYTGLYVPPVSEDDVLYPVEEPTGFPEVPTPNVLEWRRNRGSGMSPFATQSFKKKYVTRGGKITNSDPGNSIEGEPACAWASVEKSRGKRERAK